MLPNVKSPETIQSVSSILKSPDSDRKLGLKVRFEAEDIVTVITNYCKGEDKVKYGNILNQLWKGEIETDVLVNWLKQLQVNISLITRQCEGLIAALLRINWIAKGDEALQVYESFLQYLLSAHTNYLKLVLKMLIDRFMPKSDLNLSFGSSEISRKPSDIGIFNAEETKQFEHVHRVLRAVLKIVPMAHMDLVPLLAECFPYMKKDAHKQACYVFNLLCITKYLPTFGRDILEIIIDKMTKIDVFSPRQEIIDAESDAAYQDGEPNTAVESIFDMDISETSPSVEEETNKDEKRLEKVVMAHEFANILDVMMNTLFSYTHDICYVEGTLDWEAAKKLYKDLLFIFDKLILTTHACCHVQFVMFYVCSFRPPLCDGFLDYLWKKVSDPNTPSILRQSAVSYIGSFLARATYISINTVIACFDLMIGWIHRYIDSQDSGGRSIADVAFHGPFFSVCQAVFYVFAFRHKELLTMPKGFQYLQNLNFERIVTCCLNPLKFCLPAVVRNFASIARNYQLAYCYTIIEKNNRAKLQTVSRNPAQAVISTKNALDSFFPFDPYLLLRSSTHIKPIYREYQGPLDDEPVENNESYDDILEVSLVSPTPTPVTIPEFLLYGSSPGFKHVPMVT